MKIEKSTLLGEKTKTSRSRQLNIKCMRDRIRSDEREWEVCRWRRRKMYRNPQHFHSIYSTAGYANLGRRSCWITFSLSASLAANKFTFLSRFCKWSHRRTRRNESCVLYIWTRKKIRKFTKIKDCRSKKKSSQRSMTVVVNREYRKTVWMTKKKVISFKLTVVWMMRYIPSEWIVKMRSPMNLYRRLSSRMWAFEDRMCINLLVNRSMD